MSRDDWEANKIDRLDVYIYDYLIKRNLHESAKAFQAEANVSSNPIAIDAPGGFLFEWWSVFWDIYNARTNEKHSDVAASHIQNQLIKAQEDVQQKQQQQQIQMQQLLLRRHLQQQQQNQQLRRGGAHLQDSAPNGQVAGDPLMR